MCFFYQISLLVLILSAMVLAKPDSILDFEGDDHQHSQDGDAGKSVEGSYR